MSSLGCHEKYAPIPSAFCTEKISISTSISLTVNHAPKRNIDYKFGTSFSSVKTSRLLVELRIAVTVRPTICATSHRVKRLQASGSALGCLLH